MAPMVKTPQEVKDEILSKGQTIKEVAENIGCDYPTVFALLNGLSKGNRGKAHKAAVALGIKRAA